MNTRLTQTLEQIENLLRQEAAAEPDWKSKDKCYQWIEITVKYFKYRSMSKPERGVVRQYLGQVSGYSRAQIARLIRQDLS